ncbi:high frequency lysogenization protein HflD [Actinobacillus equuli subsp. equuli]|uniref:High frequency lysogenization protein HflD homolog n=1 Tax=Actinobacillus equuli TaxID=718 RepID=A0AAX3FGQ7_ACTEU|nr:high frequency lysogenization protein HflD [Actinobacillus equuli]AIZ79157.1 lysogenization regulator [Actinobacillus equuli subsp. equuli]MDG4952400.1 high frequency lysogenization protein HflD [Actinobacillus equuli subsp. equuli]WGE45400.1 high frequency lysogenization protein HflD [Actinobacillus equuli subsp. equuli]WGE49548.1 high frequency lysogenization protein HflD [Actinobacillus equuli subsp. equuli]WGE55932.1 high frequency lysogenization protein HflD [Actinobacillus equuli subs
MSTNYHDITLAFAGVCQAVSLVQQFAHRGSADRDVFSHSIKSLLVTQPESTLAVFGDQLSHLKTGLETVQAQMGSPNGKLDTEIGRYWINVLALSQKLNKNPEAKAKLAERLQQIERQLPLYENDIMADQMIANLAAIYSDVISPLGSKIHVLGLQDYLVRPDIQQKIRASLLAGIRAGILWQQVGGTRWQFLFSRRKILNQAQQFYKSI